MILRDEMLAAARRAATTPEGRAELVADLCETLRAVAGPATVILLADRSTVAAITGIADGLTMAREHVEFLADVIGHRPAEG